uniref:CDK5 regulatory subunit-associated protein 2/Myomegalin coiled coil domain-containing protein n=1 Tax=Monopterus albus TaxID=43700 RepID=A0A3Q3K620_MONAL
MEHELRSLRQASQSQERTIQDLTESISTKDSEAQELYQLIEGQNTTLCKLREMAHRNHLGASESLTLAQLQGELVRVQSSLFSLGLELEANQRSLRQSQRQGEDLVRLKDRLNSDLQEALQHREVTEKHNQVSVFVMRSIDDKFHCLEEHEAQVRRLQQALREKERDLERLRCILSNNEDTITSLDALVRGKELELEQAAEAYRNLQWLKQQGEEKERNAQREKDTIISQLQETLQSRSQEVQELTATLVARVQAGPTEVVEELKSRLALKEKLFQELLTDRSRQSNEHHAQVQDLLSALSSKDQYLQVGHVASICDLQIVHDKRKFKSLQSPPSFFLRTMPIGICSYISLGFLPCSVCFIFALSFIYQELMQGQEEAMHPSSKEREAEVKALEEELQLALKKEREAQVSVGPEMTHIKNPCFFLCRNIMSSYLCVFIMQKELSALHLSLARQQGITLLKNYTFNCVLEQLVSEYNKLNDALRAEKRLYQNLTQIHTKTDSTEKIQALHTELDSVQALRGQLEEVLARTRKMALGLERATKRQSDSGGGDGQGSASRAAQRTVTNAP